MIHPTEPFRELETARLTLRACGPGDAARLQAVFAAAADHFAPAGPGPEAATHEITQAADEPGRAVALLTLSDGTDVGALGWWEGRPEPGLALLGTLVVVPDHRGRGFAREALEGVEIWLAGRGVVALRTAFPRRRFAFHPVVRALGFQEMSIAEHQKLGLAGAGTSLWEKPVGARG